MLQEEPVSTIAVTSGASADFALMSDHTLRAWGGDQDGKLSVPGIGVGTGNNGGESVIAHSPPD